VPEPIVDPFGAEVIPSSPIAILGLGRRARGEESSSVVTPPSLSGVHPLPTQYWERIHDSAELFRRELSSRQALGRRAITASHLRLSSSGDAEVTELELELLGAVDLITWLCATPHMDLRFETERAPIDRSRRVAPNAIPYLASHSEDWLLVTLRGPVPKQILSQFREDEIAIYENRMVRTLLDGCTAWLRQLESLLREMKDADEERIELNDLAYFLRFQRLGRWLDGEEDQHLQSVRDRFALVEDLLRTLGQLRGSLLFEGTDEAAHVDGLHMTNLLMNDGRYLTMVRLWDVWQRQLTLSRTDEDQDDEVARRRERDLDAYAHLLTLRALESLGAIDPETGESTLADVDVQIQPAGFHGSHRVHFLHASGEEVTLLVGAVPYGLGDSLDPFEDPRTLHDALNALDASARERNELCCLVHPALRSRLATSELSWVRSLSADASHVHPSVWSDLEGLIVLPAHPLGVDCLETFGRMYRLIIETLRSRAFPLAVPISGALLDIPDAAIDVQGSGLEVRDRRLVLVASAINHSALESDGRAGRRGRQARPQDAVDWGAVLEPLARMRQGLLTCPAFPVEHRDLTPTVQYWDATGFRAICPSCPTIWGIRSCDSCRQRYHYMVSDSDAQWDEAGLTGGPAAYFGMALTSEPCVHERGSFICPACHRCQGRKTSPDCMSCAR